LTSVVVTRPSPDHEVLCRALRSRGYQVVHSPAFERVAEPPKVREQRLASLGRYDLVIVISPFAARLLVESGPGPGPVCLTPGAGTGRRLLQAGYRVSWPESGGTSEDLLRCEGLRDVAGMRVCIVGAPGGRRLLDEKLAGRGATVERIDLYRRRALENHDDFARELASERALIVLVSSVGAFDSLDHSVRGALRSRWLQATFVVSSDRVGQRCAAAGAHSIVRAAGASDRAMLAAVDEAGGGARL